MTQLRITDDLDALLNVLPEAVSQAVREANDSDNLLEVILDLGRVPTARFHGPFAGRDGRTPRTGFPDGRILRPGKRVAGGA